MKGVKQTGGEDERERERDGGGVVIRGRWEKGKDGREGARNGKEKEIKGTKEGNG